MSMKFSHVLYSKSVTVELQWLEQAWDHEKYSIAQLVTCLATDMSLTADPGVVSLIPARSHTFVEIDREITSTVNLLPSA